ncbi:hypothetical protein H9P43_004418 [Blastocladiella emersonii ATCC 22665]|nr:hypothetical protein H9P43_004418 [Blastocladiella emersonii ATCC 22665]
MPLRFFTRSNSQTNGNGVASAEDAAKNQYMQNKLAGLPVASALPARHGSAPTTLPDRASSDMTLSAPSQADFAYSATAAMTALQSAKYLMVPEPTAASLVSTHSPYAAAGSPSASAKWSHDSPMPKPLALGSSGNSSMFHSETTIADLPAIHEYPIAAPHVPANLAAPPPSTARTDSGIKSASALSVIDGHGHHASPSKPAPVAVAAPHLTVSPTSSTESLTQSLNSLKFPGGVDKAGSYPPLQAATADKEPKKSAAKSLLSRLLKGGSSKSKDASSPSKPGSREADKPMAQHDSKELASTNDIYTASAVVDASLSKSAPTTPAPPKHEKLTPEQKQAKALAERERRLHEVLSVLEGRKPLPAGMQDLEFANFIGDGTYGFVVTAFRGAQEVAVKFIFKDKIPVTAWMKDATYGMVPSEIFFLKNLSHPNMVKLIDCFEDEKYIMAITELHGTSWDAANPVLQAGIEREGLRKVPRAQRVGSEGKGDLNTLSSLSSKQREMLRPRVSCDLFECIDAHDYFPEGVVRFIFRQVVEVVSYMHDNGVVHRDLKDENIVIDENYVIKLIDFGSAAYIPPSQGPFFDKFLGTMDFAAPEIIEGYRYRGPEVEIWALGVLLYILVFRQIPFKSQQDTLDVVYKKPKELAQFYPGAHELYDLLDRMLQRHPQDRACLKDVLAHPWMLMHS